MALFILVTALVIEAALATYSIITKSEQKRVKNYIRLGELALFLFFAILPVIEMSFRWTGLILLLIVKAVIAAISLLRKKEEKAYKPLKIICRGLGASILIAAMLIPAFIFPQYRLPVITGNYEIGTAAYTYVDENRVETFVNTGENREINVEFWYPKNAEEGETFPLVIFSHGAFGIKASNTSAYMELASNGYVVCAMDHPYHSMGTMNADGKLTLIDQKFFNEAMGINSDTLSEEEIYNMTKKWMNVRVADMEFALNTILEKEADPAQDAVYHMINPEKIGLAGHSMGGATAAQVARQRDDIDAVIDMEGTMMGEYIGFENGTTVINPQPYPVPILHVYTDNVLNQLEEIENSQYEFVNQIVSATAPAHYEVWIRGTNHMSLTDLILFSPFLVSMIESAAYQVDSSKSADPYFILDTLNASILDFFNCYLKDGEAFTMAGEYTE